MYTGCKGRYGNSGRRKIRTPRYEAWSEARLHPSPPTQVSKMSIASAPSARGTAQRCQPGAPREPASPKHTLAHSVAYTDASRRSAFARLVGREEVADSGDLRQFHSPCHVDVPRWESRDEDLRHRLNRQWEIPRPQRTPHENPLPRRDVPTSQTVGDT